MNSKKLISFISITFLVLTTVAFAQTTGEFDEAHDLLVEHLGGSEKDLTEYLAQLSKVAENNAPAAAADFYLTCTAAGINEKLAADVTNAAVAISGVSESVKRELIASVVEAVETGALEPAHLSAPTLELAQAQAVQEIVEKTAPTLATTMPDFRGFGENIEQGKRIAEALTATGVDQAALGQQTEAAIQAVFAAGGTADAAFAEAQKVIAGVVDPEVAKQMFAVMDGHKKYMDDYFKIGGDILAGEIDPKDIAHQFYGHKDFELISKGEIPPGFEQFATGFTAGGVSPEDLPFQLGAPPGAPLPFSLGPPVTVTPEHETVIQEEAAKLGFDVSTEADRQAFFGAHPPPEGFDVEGGGVVGGLKDFFSFFTGGGQPPVGAPTTGYIPPAGFDTSQFGIAPTGPTGEHAFTAPATYSFEGGAFPYPYTAVPEGGSIPTPGQIFTEPSHTAPSGSNVHSGSLYNIYQRYYRPYGGYRY